MCRRWAAPIPSSQSEHTFIVAVMIYNCNGDSFHKKQPPYLKHVIQRCIHYYWSHELSLTQDFTRRRRDVLLADDAKWPWALTTIALRCSGLSLSYFPGPIETTVPRSGRSLAVSGSTTPPMVTSEVSSTCTHPLQHTT
jgi:hypothetical protein